MGRDTHSPQTSLTRWVLLTGLLALVICFGGSASAATGDGAGVRSHARQVLILSENAYGLPVSDMVVAGIIERLKARKISTDDIFVEYLDLVRNRDAAHRANLRNMLRHKLAHRNIVMIITLSPGAIDFLAQEGTDLFPNAPVLAYRLPERGIRWQVEPRKVVELESRMDVAGTLRYALALFPKARHLAVINGADTTGSIPPEQVTAALDQIQRKLTVERTEALSYEEMLQRVASLPPDTIAIYGAYFNDRTGRSFIPSEVAATLARRANAPVFGLFDIHVFQGLIGGSVVDNGEIGRRAGDFAGEYLQGNITLDRQGTVITVPHLALFNWSQLARWEGNVTRLPAGSVFLDRPASLWAEYKGVIISSIGVILLQGGLIVALLLQNRRRKQAEEAAREGETRFRLLIEQAPEAILVYDVDRKIIADANTSAEKLFGCNREELRQSGLQRFCLPGQAVQLLDCQTFSEHIERALAGESLQFELAVASIDGRTHFCEVHLVRLPSEQRRLVRTSFIDITGRKQLEEQLRQSQKLEAIGQFAGGVAHDFNNILQVIMAHCSLMEMGAALNGKQQEHLVQISAAAERAVQLTRGLLAFSRKEVTELREADLNAIVQHLLKFLSRIIGEDIHFGSNFSPEPLPVFVDSGQIEQVLINLVTNARDAMPQGGILRVETELQTVSAPIRAAFGLLEPGRYACITVSDTGSGMTEEVSAQMFEPFFTTKEEGKGTGLGMVIICGIVEQHKGAITFRSEPGQGTAFSVYLPIMESRQTPQAAPAETAAAQAGYETILLAEDDVSVRTITTSILTKYGYEVIQARDGEEAVEKFIEHRDRIRLILMDMIMPRKSGKEAYEAICRVQPGAKVLYISGYSADFLQERGMSEEGIERLVKPIKSIQLLTKVREMLDSDDGGEPSGSPG